MSDEKNPHPLTSSFPEPVEEEESKNELTRDATYLPCLRRLSLADGRGKLYRVYSGRKGSGRPNYVGGYRVRDGRLERLVAWDTPDGLDLRWDHLDEGLEVFAAFVEKGTPRRRVRRKRKPRRELEEELNKLKLEKARNEKKNEGAQF